MAEMCPLCLYQSVHHVSGLYSFLTAFIRLELFSVKIDRGCFAR